MIVLAEPDLDGHGAAVENLLDGGQRLRVLDRGLVEGGDQFGLVGDQLVVMDRGAAERRVAQVFDRLDVLEQLLVLNDYLDYCYHLSTIHKLFYSLIK